MRKMFVIQPIVPGREVRINILMANLREAIDLGRKYGMSYAEVVGSLELAKAELVAEAFDEGERQLESAITEVGKLKQGMWQTKDAEIATWKDAYENMRDFAIKSGLDITCYGPKSV